MAGNGAALTNKISQRQVTIGHNTLDLMELRQMGGIGRFISEHAINAEDLRGLEPSGLLGNVAQ